MNLKRIGLFAAVAALAVSAAACTQVTPGHVGIKVNQYGGGAGVDPTPKGVGTYLLTPGVHYVDYPTFTVTKTWSKNSHEGREAVNEEFQFQDAGGLLMESDVTVTYHVDPKLAAIFYQKYRQEMDVIEDTQLRNEVRNSLVEHAAAMKVDDIMGPRKVELINAVQADVKKYFAPYGLVIEQIYWAGAVRPPPQVQQQINLKLSNDQAALAAQANVATAEANGRARVAQATAEAQANTLLAASIRANPEIVNLKAIEKWDGVLPTMMNGATPFINVSKK